MVGILDTWSVEVGSWECASMKETAIGCIPFLSDALVVDFFTHCDIPNVPCYLCLSALVLKHKLVMSGVGFLP